MNYLIYYKITEPKDYNAKTIRADSVMEAIEKFGELHQGQVDSIFKIENLTVISGYYI